MKQDFFSIDPYIEQQARDAEARCRPAFSQIEETASYNTAKVLSAFSRHQVSESHLSGSTGYGYGDRGRETLEAVFATITGCEAALYRHNFMSGTHALSTALFGILRPGDEIICVTGLPYDTIHSVLGLKETGIGSLRDFGIKYRQLDLLPDGTPDYRAIPGAVKNARMVYIQRSRGYLLRPSLNIASIGRIVGLVRQVNPGAVILVDNCYGEFVETSEPTQCGADLIAGSLIKNPGGGIAKTGGYIAGRADLVKLCAHRLSAPGVGGEIGCTLDQLRPMYMGLFFAPSVVASAVKTAIFSAALFENLGFSVTPRWGEQRTDIIQTLLLGTPERLVSFCRGIQRGAPVDSFAVPEPWDMPGYSSPVIMAAGAFTMGASIELSADAPMREPYAVWLQGGLTYPSGRLGILLAAQSMLEEGTL